MMGPAWWWLAAALVSTPPTCGTGTDACCPAHPTADATPLAVLVAVNRERLRAGEEPMRLDPALCTVAAARAAALAAAGSLDVDERAIAEVSRRLYAAGYRAQRWSEQPVVRRGGAPAVLDAWRRLDPERYREAIDGDFSDLGVGQATLDGMPLTLILLGLPRHTAFLREAHALGTIEELRAALIVAANAERQRAGLAPLAREARLDEAAQAHASDLVARDYYEHTTLEGAGVLERLAKAGFRARVAAENLARGPFSPADAVARWMLSSGHRANLLSPRFDRVGAGIVLDERPAKEQFTFVLDFAAGD
jgi:uncharacterized protein YkwD